MCWYIRERNRQRGFPFLKNTSHNTKEKSWSCRRYVLFYFALYNSFWGATKEQRGDSETGSKSILAASTTRLGRASIFSSLAFCFFRRPLPWVFHLQWSKEGERREGRASVRSEKSPKGKWGEGKLPQFQLKLGKGFFVNETDTLPCGLPKT